MTQKSIAEKREWMEAVERALQDAIRRGPATDSTYYVEGDDGRRVYTQPYCSSVPTGIRREDLFHIRFLKDRVSVCDRVTEGAIVELEFPGEDDPPERYLALDIENSISLPPGVRIVTKRSPVGMAIFGEEAGREVITNPADPQLLPKRVRILSVR